MADRTLMIARNADALIAVGLVGILVLMIVPIPPMFLDISMFTHCAF